jgi:hypothetical protein
VPPLLYSEPERERIVAGYQKLDGLTDLLQQAARCRACHRAHVGRLDLPLNALVRPLPSLRAKDQIQRYLVRVKRDDTFLRGLLRTTPTAEEAFRRLGSAKFAIGLLPWLDRCMGLRRGKTTTLMVVGIDYKHFPVFFRQPKDHCFPLDSYRSTSNVWGPSWRGFWSGLLGKYDDELVDRFIAERGVYFTNSMLCFGGGINPNDHPAEFVTCCRPFIERQIEIVKPEVLVSFGDPGAWNVATILHKHDPTPLLARLSGSRRPLSIVADMARRGTLGLGIDATVNGRRLRFWPLYQPARRHFHGFPGDYDVLRRMLGL